MTFCPKAVGSLRIRSERAIKLQFFRFHASYRITVFLISSMLENYSISDFMHVTEFKCVLVRATAYVRIPGSSKSIVRKN